MTRTTPLGSRPPARSPAGAGIAPLPPPPRPVGTKAATLRAILAGLLLAGVGGGVGYVLARLHGRSSTGWGLEPVELALFFAALVPAAALPLLVHELGHVVGGLASGFRFDLLIWGPLRLERGPRGARAGLNRSLALAGGLALCTPRGSGDLRQGMLRMVAGGPLVSLVSGGAALAAYFGSGLSDIAPDPARLPALWLATSLWLFGLVSLVLGVVTTVPSRTSGFPTDGARLRTLLRGGAAARREEGLLAILAAASGGTRPRDWEADWVEAILAPADGSPSRVFALLLAYAHALDRGHPATAGEHMAAVLTGLDALAPAAHDNVYLEAAFFEAAVRRDRERAEAWQGRVGGGPFTDRSLAQAVEIALRTASSEDASDPSAEEIRKWNEADASGTELGLRPMRLDWLTRSAPDLRTERMEP